MLVLVGGVLSFSLGSLYCMNVCVSNKSGVLKEREKLTKMSEREKINKGTMFTKWSYFVNGHIMLVDRVVFVWI